jgi:molybdopterin converting factor small subunit
LGAVLERGAIQNRDGMNPVSTHGGFMSITVQIPTALRRLTAGRPQLTCSAANLGELFSELDTQFPDLKPHLRDEAGETRRFLNIYVNEVLLVPSIAGGLG